MGSVFLHLAIEGSSPTIRQAVLTAIKAAILQSPQTINRMVRETLMSFCLRDVSASKPGEEQETTWRNQGRLLAFLLHAVSFGENVDVSDKEDILIELIILAHHDLACKFPPLLD